MRKLNIVHRVSRQTYENEQTKIQKVQSSAPTPYQRFRLTLTENNDALGKRRGR
jgi:hypothetical protein